MSRFDAHFCAFYAATLFTTDSKQDSFDHVTFSTVSSDDRFPNLQEDVDAYDIIVRTTTNTMSRDAFSNCTFARSNFYDGQGFLVRIDDDWGCFLDCESMLASAAIIILLSSSLSVCLSVCQSVSQSLSLSLSLSLSQILPPASIATLSKTDYARMVH